MIEGRARGVKTVGPWLPICALPTPAGHCSQKYPFMWCTKCTIPGAWAGAWLSLTFTQHCTCQSELFQHFSPFLATQLTLFLFNPFKIPRSSILQWDRRQCRKHIHGGYSCGDAAEMHREQGRGKWPISQSCPAHQPMRSQVSGSSHTDGLIKVVIKV